MKRTIVLLALIICVVPSYAARDWDFTATWNMGVPTGELGRYIEEYGWAGFGGELQYHLDDHNKIGVASGWQRWEAFYRDELTEFPQGALFGSQVRRVASVPLVATIQHTMADPIDKIQPYLKLGAGMYWMTKWFEAGVYSLSETTTHFGLMPSAGLNFRLNRQSNMIVQLDYNAMFDSGETLSGGEENTYSYIGIKIGFTFGQ